MRVYGSAFVLLSSVVTVSLLLQAAPVSAWNYTLSVREDDRRVIDLGVFGFAEGGVMELNLKTFDLVETEELQSRDEKIGFVLDLVESATYARQERNYAKNEEQKNRICFVNDKAVMPELRYLIALENPLADGKVKVSPKKKGGLKQKMEAEEKKKSTGSDDDAAEAKPKKKASKKASADDADAADGPAAPPPPKKKSSKKAKADGDADPSQARRGFAAQAEDDAEAKPVAKKPKKVKKASDDDAGDAPPPPPSKKKKTADDADAESAPSAAAGGDDDGETPSVYSVKMKVNRPGLYALFYYNCKRYYQEKLPVHTSFDVDIRQYNVYDNGNSVSVSFIGVGDHYLPLMYMLFAAFFLVGLVFWHRALGEAKASSATPGASRQQLHKVHYFLYALGCLKILTLILDAVMLDHRKNTGGLRGVIDYLFYTFQTLKGIALFTVIVLLGSGWSILKPILSDRDRMIIIVILPLQILGNIALAVLDETSEGSASWSTWKNALRIFDVVCCCAVILPVAWTIQTFSTSAEGKTTRDLHRMKQFRTFYLVVVAFVYWTRIVIPMAEGLVPYNYTWAPPFLYELVAFCFYAFLGVRFRPQSKESLLRSEQDDAEEGEGEELTARRPSEVLASRKAVDDGDVQIGDDAPAAAGGQSPAATAKGA